MPLPIANTVVFQRNPNDELIVTWKYEVNGDTKTQTVPAPNNNFIMFFNPDNENWYSIALAEQIPSNWRPYLYEIGA